MTEALHDALKAGDVDRLAELLAAGEDPNKRIESCYNFPPLQVAVNQLRPRGKGDPSGSIDAIVLLLRYGAEVDGWDEDHSATALLTAMDFNHVEAARILLAAGADPNVRSDEGETPLRLCAENGFLEMVRLLLRCGADVHESGGGAGMNALGLAATRLNLDMVKLLLAYGADPNVPDLDRMTVLDHLRRFPHVALPETPEKGERLQEIRRLLGGPPLVPKEP